MKLDQYYFLQILEMSLYSIHTLVTSLEFAFSVIVGAAAVQNDKSTFIISYKALKISINKSFELIPSWNILEDAPQICMTCMTE